MLNVQTTIRNLQSAIYSKVILECEGPDTVFVV